MPEQTKGVSVSVSCVFFLVWPPAWSYCYYYSTTETSASTTASEKMKKAATMAVATSQLVWLHLSPLARLGSQLGQSGTDPSPTAIIRRAVENTENTTKNNTKYEKMLETMTIFSPQAKTLTTKCRQMYHKFSYNFPAVLEKPQHSWGFGFSVFFSPIFFLVPFGLLRDFWVCGNASAAKHLQLQTKATATMITCS